jgi:hypothetical protein
MASTKFEVCSAALVMIGANPVSSFSASGTSEQVACYHLYQSTLDGVLSMHQWRFATKMTLLSRESDAPDSIWSAAYDEPTDMVALQSVVVDTHGNDIPFDRFNGQILCDAGSTQAVYAIHTFEPAVSQWPGYFVKVMEFMLADQFAISLAAKLDMAKTLEGKADRAMRFAKNTDSKQQTTRRLRTTGRNTIIEARRR